MMKPDTMVLTTGRLTVTYVKPEPGSDYKGIAITVGDDEADATIRLDWAEAEVLRRWLKAMRRQMPFMG